MAFTIIENPTSVPRNFTGIVYRTGRSKPWQVWQAPDLVYIAESQEKAKAVLKDHIRLREGVRRKA